MIEQLAEWAQLVILVGAFVGSLLTLLEFLEKLEKVKKLIAKLPHLLKLIAKFLIYILSLAGPNVIIIWYFFYQAGLSPDRLSEVEFFRAVVMNPTIFVSLYAFIWGIWIYPRLKRLLGGSKSRTSNELSDSGGKK